MSLTSTPVLHQTPYSVPVEAQRIAAFAQAIGETREIYYNPAAAHAEGYRDIPIPPTMMFALSLKGPDPFAWMADIGFDLRNLLHGEQGFDYHQPVCAGDILTFYPRISNCYSRKGGELTFVVRDTRVDRQDGVHVADLHNVLIRRRI